MVNEDFLFGLECCLLSDENFKLNICNHTVISMAKCVLKMITFYLFFLSFHLKVNFGLNLPLFRNEVLFQ
jgi:hypothetical protein